MYSVVSILVIVVSAILILLVLVQDSKGGGLASNFSASNQVMGVRKTTDFLGKATWYLAGGLLVLSLVAVMVIKRPDYSQTSTFDEKLEEMAQPQPELPTFPAAESAPAPAEAAPIEAAPTTQE